MTLSVRSNRGRYISTMSSSFAGSRLAAVANQRRQQRKQQKNAATENNAPSTVSYSSKNTSIHEESKISHANNRHRTNTTSTASTVSIFDDSTVTSESSLFSLSTGTTNRENKENSGKYQQKLGLICTTTESMTFDESTVSSAGDWSAKKMNRGQPSTPPMTILSPSKKTTTNINIRAPADTVGSKPTMVETPSSNRRIRNSKLRGGRILSNNTEIPSATPKSNTVYICKTPKYNNLSNSNQRKLNNDNSMVSLATSETNQEQIRHLTLERDNLQSDVALCRRKLLNAIDSNAKATTERDAVIRDLESKLKKLSQELEKKTGEALMATLQAREMEQLVAVDDERKRSLHRKELNAVQSELDRTLDELARAKHVNEELIDEKKSLESKGHELCKVLQQVEEERSNMKSRVKKYSEQLSKVQMECEVSLSVTHR